MVPTRRIKVCQVLNAYDVGGAETVALDLARGLDPERFESLAVALIAPRAESEPEMQRRFGEAGVPAYSLHNRSYRDPRTWWSVIRFLRRHRPDIIHGHNRFADLWAGRLAGWAGVQAFLWTRHLVYDDMSPRQIGRYRSLAGRAGVVLAVSDAVHRYCLDTEGLPPALVRTVVNGIDTERFRPLAAAQRQAVRTGLGLEAHEHLLLFVGRLTAQKAPEAFVALIRRLREKGIAARGFLCGRGDLADHLVELTAATEGVTLLGLRNDVPDLLAACDLFVSSSRNEGLPLNVMEAMTAGAAFTAPDLAQVVQLVAGHEELAAGLYPAPPPSGEVPADLIETWSDLVADRLADGEQRERCGRAGRAIIEEQFSLARMVREHETIYESLLRRG